jgi:hypothetical protein
VVAVVAAASSSASSALLLAQDTIVAGYRVDGVLGAGGMGTVYRATQLSLNRVVALKVLAQELSDDAGFRARFEREGQLQAGLDHEHIVTVYEAGQTEHGLFLAMRLIDGPTLKALIRSRQLDPRRALRILAQVANALDEAHAAGLIHRDVKPQNILIGRDDHTYLCDFGLIKSPDDSQSLTGTGQFLGTIDYVAPEMIQGEPATAASDVYSLCAVLYECLTGQVPFARPNETATLHAHIIEAPPKPTDLRPELPPAIDAVIAAGMAKDPTARPASAGELIRRAAAVMAGVELSGQTPASEQPIASVQATRPADVIRPTTAPTRASAAPAAPADATRISEPATPQTRGSWPLRAAVVVLAAAAIVVGALIGHSGTKHRRSTAPLTTAVAGPLRLHYPSAWQPLGTAPTLPGAAFSSAIVLSGTAPVAGTVDAGVVTNAVGPTLLAPRFIAALAGPPPAGQPVKLAGFAALRYGPIAVHGVPGAVTIYVAPTAAGVVTIACIPASSAFGSSCGRVAATAQLLGVSADPLGPTPAYASALAAALARLHGTIAPGLAALSSARSHSAQALAARRIAGGYTTAATALARLTTSPRDRGAAAALTVALRQLAAGYGAAATAATHINTAGYARAARQLHADGTALGRALAALSALGYAIAGR